MKLSVKVHPNCSFLGFLALIPCHCYWKSNEEGIKYCSIRLYFLLIIVLYNVIKSSLLPRFTPFSY